MDLGLKGKVALVLGGGGGLGRAISIALAGEGATVAVADIDRNAIAGTEAALAAIGAKSIGLLWNLSDLSQIDAHVSRIEIELGPVDILVNNTGGPPPTPAAGQNPALWLKHFQAMVVSVIAITDRVLPKMLERHWGRIITSTSSGVVAPISNLGISNALRFRWLDGRRLSHARSAKTALQLTSFFQGASRPIGSNFLTKRRQNVRDAAWKTLRPRVRRAFLWVDTASRKSMPMW
jgi:NAD(P)-dependent dehydrogenase (short-subunit alcohol dehydrogenase family)